MEYKETFRIGGKYGIHTGPSSLITQMIFEYSGRLGGEYELRVQITKESSGESIDALKVYEIISLLGEEGDQLEVKATLTPENSNKKEILEKCVKEIGNIISHTDKISS